MESIESATTQCPKCSAMTVVYAPESFLSGLLQSFKSTIVSLIWLVLLGLGVILAIFAFAILGDAAERNGLYLPQINLPQFIAIPLLIIIAVPILLFATFIIWGLPQRIFKLTHPNLVQYLPWLLIRGSWITFTCTNCGYRWASPE